MPMLPDTLGSRAFKAASSIWVHRMENGVCLEDEAPVRLLSLAIICKADSGSLAEFKEVSRTLPPTRCRPHAACRCARSSEPRVTCTRI